MALAQKTKARWARAPLKRVKGVALPSISINHSWRRGFKSGRVFMEAESFGSGEQQYCEVEIQKCITAIMFDWNDIKYFLAVARCGSTLAAAKSLDVNQSTVHRRIQELETELACELMTRHPTGYRLTELGEYIRAYAERLEAAATDFERAVSAQSSETRGTVKVTCPEALGARLIGARLIDKFNARYPDVRIEFVMSDKIIELGTGEADIAIRAKRPVETTLVGRKIADSPWAVYASRSYVARHGSINDPTQIDGHSVVMFSGALSDHHAARWIKSVAPNAHVAARANSLAALLPSVRSGAGIAPMPTIVGENERDFVRVLDLGPEMATPFYLLTHRDLRRTPRIRAFFDFIIEHLNEVRPLLSPGYSRTKPKRGATGVRKTSRD
jgi:DNA-binding transcriptional LysR family regulator